MENSVKAILMAGAVIIVLVMITLVLNMFLSGSEIIDDGTTRVDAATIAYHNSQFSKFEKENLTYSNVISLVGKITENNQRQTDGNYVVDVEVKKYRKDAYEETYTSTNTYDVIKGPTNSEFMNNHIYPELNSNSVYRGKIFKASFMYNDYGIIHKIRIEKVM